MNTEEKILEILAQMQTDMTDVKTGLTDVNVRLGLVETRLGKVENRLSAVETTQAQMKDEIHLTNVRLELDVGQRLDALAEGQDVIEGRLGALEEVKEQVEKISDKVDVIHAVVTQHSGTITELKKAQG